MQREGSASSGARNREALATLFREYHAGVREASDEELDEALGLSARICWSTDEEDEREKSRHPGESVANVPTPYRFCRGLFSQLALGPDDVFVDLGAGTGRVVLYASLVTPARCIGIELVEARVLAARAVAERAGLTEVELRHENAAVADLSEGTVFYCHRSFSEEKEGYIFQRLHAVGRRRPVTIALHRIPTSLDGGLFEGLSEGWLRIYRSSP